MTPEKESTKKCNTYKICFILESVVQVGDPPAVAPDEDVPLLLEAGRLRPFQHLPLVQDLERKDTVRGFELDYADLTECAAADHLQDFKVILGEAEGFHAVSHGFHCKEKKEKEDRD